VTPVLNLKMLLFVDIVNRDVRFGAAGKRAGNFFGHKEIGEAPQLFGCFDGIMVGNGHQIHAHALQLSVDLNRVRVAFPAEAIRDRDCAHAGVQSMDVQVALHQPHLKALLLQSGEASNKRS